MRIRSLVLVLLALFAFPLLAADLRSDAAARPVGILNLDGEQIEVYSWSWGATQTAESSTGGGGGAGKVQMQDFHFTKTVDRSSPKLFEACATGRHIPTATLTVRKAGGGQQEYMVVKFSDLLVTSYQTGGSSGDAMPSESIALNFARVEFDVPGR